MSYALIADLKAVIPYLTISSSTVPTLVQATAILDDTSSEIDTVLAGRGITPPVTTPTYFVERLRLLNTYGAAAAVLKGFFPEADAGSGGGLGANPAWKFWEDRYREGLKALRSGADIPTDLGTGISNVAPSGYFTRNPEVEEELGTLAGASAFKVAQEF